MPRTFVKTLRIILGVASILLGLIGVVIPLLQGWFFIGIGILLIAPEKGKRLLAWIKRKVGIGSS